MENQIATIRAASEVDWLTDAEFREFTQAVLAASDDASLGKVLSDWKVSFVGDFFANLEAA